MRSTATDLKTLEWEDNILYRNTCPCQRVVAWLFQIITTLVRLSIDTTSAEIFNPEITVLRARHIWNNSFLPLTLSLSPFPYPLPLSSLWGDALNWDVQWCNSIGANFFWSKLTTPNPAQNTPMPHLFNWFHEIAEYMIWLYSSVIVQL